MTRFRIGLNRGKSRRGPGLNFFFLLTLLPLTVGREGIPSWRAFVFTPFGLFFSASAARTTLAPAA
jgi:hypothetical protein